MTRRVEATPQGKAIAAWIVTDSRGRLQAKVQARFGSGGGVLVNVFDADHDFVQAAHAGGYGYDKLTAALSGMVIGGHTLSNHCEVSKKPPKGAPLFPRDYKTPRGYSLANFTTMVRDDSGSPWRQMTMEESRASRFMHWSADWRAELSDEFGERTNADKLAAMAVRGDTLMGYASCYKIAGLEYLRARGLRVYQAI